jgi:hypothetical protein
MSNEISPRLIVYAVQTVVRDFGATIVVAPENPPPPDQELPEGAVY